MSQRWPEGTTVLKSLIWYRLELYGIAVFAVGFVVRLVIDGALAGAAGVAAMGVFMVWIGRGFGAQCVAITPVGLDVHNPPGRRRQINWAEVRGVRASRDRRGRVRSTVVLVGPDEALTLPPVVASTALTPRGAARRLFEIVTTAFERHASRQT